MTIVAEQYRHVIGVDTHAGTRTYAILDAGPDAPPIPRHSPRPRPG